jgi:plastocyanin
MATGRRWLALVIGVLVAWPLVGPARADSDTVLLKGVRFDPKTVEIQPGETVVWKYESGQQHSVRFENGPEVGCTGLLGTDCLDQPGETRSRTFSNAGQFPYYCRFHGGPGGEGMSGVVRVEAATTTLPPASTSTTRLASTTTTTQPSTTTTTRRPLTTSSTVMSTSSTTAPALPPTTLTPNEPPPFDPGDGATTGPAGNAAASVKRDDRDSSVVAVIVALLLVVAVGGGFLLWRLRPGRGVPPG